MNTHQLHRRTFLKAAAGLCVSFAFAGNDPAVALAADSPDRNIDPTKVDSFLSIAPTGRVTLYTGKVDLGTGARAAYRQIIAEELGVAIDEIDHIEGDTSLTPDQGRTAASAGVAVGGMQLLRVAATARHALIGLAAKRLNVAAERLKAENGTVRVVDGTAQVRFADLLTNQSFNLTVDKGAVLSNPDAYRIIGQSVPRPDLPDKMTGAHTYVHDFKLPGMLHGRVIRPPMSALGATLVSVDETSLGGIPGIVKVVRIGDFLGVVAETEWSAIRAARQLKVTWTPKRPLPGSKAIYDAVRNGPIAHDEVVAKSGDATAALASQDILSATYLWPAQSHGSIGPSCAVADVTATTATIWTGSQSTHAFKPVFARFLKLDPAKVRLVYLDGSGCYGMNGHEDAAADAAILSQAVGKPVRVQWMREDEHGLDPKGPPQVLDLKGAVDKGGRISVWETQAWLLENTKNHLTVTLLGPLSAGLDQVIGIFAGIQGGNCDPPYAIPDMRTLVHWLPATDLRSANLRAPGKLGNAFAVESFTDELAHKAGADPLAFRLQALTDPRAHDVLQSVAKRMNWSARAPAFQASKAEPIARGRGIAYVHYKQMDNYVAIGIDVEVDKATGTIRVVKVTCAHDCGMMVNPDAVHAQVEGCILQTISRTLLEEVMFDKERVTSLDWNAYPILTFSDVPTLDIDLIDRRHERPVGAGEAASAPVPAALANAVYDAVGIRLRQAPFTPERVKEALKSVPS